MSIMLHKAEVVESSAAMSEGYATLLPLSRITILFRDGTNIMTFEPIVLFYVSIARIRLDVIRFICD